MTDYRILLIINNDVNILAAIEQEAFKNNSKVITLIFGEEIVIIVKKENYASVANFIQEHGLTIHHKSRVFNHKNLRLVYQKGASFEQEKLNHEILYNKGRFLLVDNLGQNVKSHSHCWHSKLITGSKVIFNSPSLLKVSRLRRNIDDVEKLLESIDLQRLKQRLQELENFYSRYCYSATYDKAANWALKIFKDLGYTTEKQVFMINGQETSNIIATKKTTQDESDSNKEIIITAHLDSINHRDKDGYSPGADDNGSGVVACLEIAQIISQQMSTKCNITFVLFGAEEIGLIGSKYFTSQLTQQRKDSIICALNMDMVGCHNSQVHSVLIEGTEGIKPLMDEITHIASLYTKLKVQHSYEPFASDHVSFINAGIPSFLTIEGDDSANNRIHTEFDTLSTINFEFLQEIIKMNLAFLLTQTT